ncbi:MAG: hypothetical protein KGI84_04155 [Elusimicrobia bacterium]|nr:hypothetical protein [Elusimicrobiota bacterium]
MRKIVLIAFLPILGRPAAAQVAAASTQLLSQGPGAQAAALSGAVVSTVRDPSALYWNPAGLAHAGGALSGEHLFLFGGARYDYIGLSVPTPFGTFGAGALQLNRDNIVARSAIDDPGYDVSNTQSVFMAGYGRDFGRHWSAGTTADMLDFNIAGYSGTGWGLDAGTQGRYWSDHFLGLNRVVWNVGADVKNLIEPSVRLMDSADTYPREFRAGAAMSFQAASRPESSGVIEHDRAEVLFSARQVAGAPGLYPALGLQYDYLHVLTVRLGFDGYVSAGFGLRTPDGRFELDYSMSDKPLSLDHRFTLTYRFEPPGAATPEDVYKEVIDQEFQDAQAEAREAARQSYVQGETDFTNQDYSKAIDDFALAGFLNPDDSDAAKSLEHAREAQRLKDIAALSSDDTLNPASGDEAAAYGDIAALLGLDSGDKDRLLRVLGRIKARVGPAAYDVYCSSAFAKGSQAALRLLAAGRVEDAKKMTDTLAVIESSQTASQVAALEEKISAQGSAVRGAFDWIYRGDGTRTDASLPRAALALLRAFPHDREADEAAQKALAGYRADHPLGIRRQFYLKKLYYLAALAYTGGTVDDLNRASGYLKEILSDDPANIRADRLLSAVQLKQSGGEHNG